MATFAGGAPKLRPALVISLLPGPYQTLLICGISTQIIHLLPNWDEMLDTQDADYAPSGVHQPSIIRLSYLYSAAPSEIAGTIGSIDLPRLDRLRIRLSDRVKP
jgi:hypothetical protein